jgi:hypothetical protein
VEVTLLELFQVGKRLVLVSEPGVGDGSVLIGDSPLRYLLDQEVEVVDRFLALAKLKVSRSPSEPSVEVVRFRVEGRFRPSQSRGGTFLGAGWRRRIVYTEVDQGGCLFRDQLGKIPLSDTGSG